MPVIPQPRPPAAGAVLTRLHEIQVAKGCLSQESLQEAARELKVSLSRLYTAATFYSAFTFRPRGRHTIRVCMGTACHIRGGERLLEKLKALLHVSIGETTENGAFTLETVHCVGSCSMSPVIRVDDDTQGRLRADRLPKILKKYENDEHVPEGKQR